MKALRRPTVVAWALDQLADRDPEGIRALLEAGARAARKARAAADRLAGQLTSARARTEDLATRHATAEASALQAELAAARAAEAAGNA